jgi:hypothetical protein
MTKSKPLNPVCIEIPCLFPFLPGTIVVFYSEGTGTQVPWWIAPSLLYRHFRKLGK